MKRNYLPKSCADCNYHSIEGMLLDVCDKGGQVLCDDNVNYEEQRDKKCPLEMENKDE